MYTSSMSHDDPRPPIIVPDDEMTGPTDHFTIANLRARVVELENQINTQQDLNTLVPAITRYYTEIFIAVKRDFHTKRMPFSQNNWVELFSDASHELTRFEEFEINKRPLNDAIVRIMGKRGGLRQSHWQALQDLRSLRNKLSHPTIGDNMLMCIVTKRWHNHPATEALSRLIRYLKRTSRTPHHPKKIHSMV
jgi:hypothetical protein